MLGFQSGALVLKIQPAKAGDIRDQGAISGSGRSPGGGHSSPLPCPCLGNPVDRGACWATVHGVAESQLTQLSVHAGCDSISYNILKSICSKLFLKYKGLIYPCIKAHKSPLVILPPPQFCLHNLLLEIFQGKCQTTKDSFVPSYHLVGAIWSHSGLSILFSTFSQYSDPWHSRKMGSTNNQKQTNKQKNGGREQELGGPRKQSLLHAGKIVRFLTFQVNFFILFSFPFAFNTSF